jgi:hypothetical protein
MRAVMLSAVMGALLAGAAQAQARFGGAHSGAWCVFYDPYTYNCGFATLQQCLATTSGVGGACQPNPSGPPPTVAPVRRKPAKPRS